MLRRECRSNGSITKIFTEREDSHALHSKHFHVCCVRRRLAPSLTVGSPTHSRPSLRTNIFYHRYSCLSLTPGFQEIVPSLFSLVFFTFWGAPDAVPRSAVLPSRLQVLLMIRRGSEDLPRVNPRPLHVATSRCVCQQVKHSRVFYTVRTCLLGRDLWTPCWKLMFLLCCCFFFLLNGSNDCVAQNPNKINQTNKHHPI